MALLETLKDSFSDNILNTALWSPVVGGNATLAEQNSRQEAALPASSTSSTVARLDSVYSYDLTGSYTHVKVVQVTASGTLSDCFLAITIQRTLTVTVFTNGFRFVKEGSILYAQRIISGATTTVASTSFNATNHAWWKISESGGTITWWTSLDGVSWTSFATYAHSMTITTMYLHIGAGCYKNETNPGSFHFDNISSDGTSTDGQIIPTIKTGSFAAFFK